MKTNIFRSIAGKTAVALLAVAGMAATTSCEEEVFTSRGTLFQPKLIAGNDDETVIVTNRNDISIVWYAIDGAVSYTVGLYTDDYYRNLFKEVTVTEPLVFIEDLPYSTAFKIRIHANAADPSNNSDYTQTSVTTEDRAEYKHLLDAIDRNTVHDNGVTVTFHPDAENPVDSISVESPLNPALPKVARYLTPEEAEAGEVVVDGLNPTTLYYVNVYNTKQPRKYDKPYNQVTFRTTGPAPMTVAIGVTDNLSDILNENNLNDEIPEGCEYELLAGTTYTISPFSIRKGFRLIGPADGDKPIVVLNGTWNVAANSEIGEVVFQNVEFRNQSSGQYFFNSGNPFTMESMTFTNVTFRNLMRGFWRHQSTTTKNIGTIELDNCIFDQCGWQTGTYGTFAFGSAGKGAYGAYDNVQNLIIRNTTFSRGGSKQDPAFGWGNLVAHNSTYLPINLTIENVTIYDFCVNNALIDISSTEGSTVVISNVLVASACGELYRPGSRTQASFSNNYATKECVLGGGLINGINLPVTADELFQNPEGGDYTIKDFSSPVYTTRAGDQRWLR